jgi:hypothetical protein
MKFVKNTRYYTGTVYEWNLPTGTTCPFALDCKVSVDRDTGKFENNSTVYRCYAASPERFPAVRNHRWNNFDFAKAGGVPVPPITAKAVRIHAAGDFFSQAYFDTWLEVCRNHPSIEFWAYTKSIKYWITRINEIPSNLELTASFGGRADHLIDEYKLKRTIVYKSESEVPSGVPIDTNDDMARNKSVQFFALLDNFAR